MVIRSEFQLAVRSSLAPLLAAALTLYFAWHAFQGDHGVFAKLRLERQAETLRKELDLTRSERQRLERRNDLMRSENLDSDMVEERVRDMLNYAHPDDVMILRGVQR